MSGNANETVRALYQEMVRAIDARVAEGASELDAGRQAFEILFADFPVPSEVTLTWTTRGGVQVLECTPPEVGNRIVVYFHGGGYTMGSVHGYRAHGAALALASGARILLVDYGLRPECPHPAAVTDGVSVYTSLLDSGVPATDIVMAGDSAGGGLALAVMLALRESGIVLPAAALLFSPFTNLVGRPSNQPAEPVADPSFSPHLVSLRRFVIGDHDPSDPLLSPIFGDFDGFPPTLLFVGTQEYLHGDSISFAEKARAAGVTVDVVIGEGMFHIYPVFAPVLPEGRAAIEHAGRFIRAQREPRD